MKIKDGRVYIYYSFDVASEVQLEKLEKVFGKKPVESQIRYTKLTPRYVKYAQPPYLVTIGEKTIELDGMDGRQFKVTAKVYDFGVISLRFSYSFSGSFEDLISFSKAIVGNEALEKEALKQAERIKKEISEALVKPISKYNYEDYIIFVAKEFDKKVTMRELSTEYGTKIAAVLRSESETLSKAQIKDTLKSSVSYFDDDAVFVDWNAAFVCDPRDSQDTLEVLEYANIELLELRTYDELLDNEIDFAYDRITPSKLPWYSIALDPFSKTLNRLEESKLDVTQVIEKVENALKLIGDPYLAKVYSAASDSFRLNKWKEGLKEKIDIIESFYDTIINRIQTVRLLVLESVVVILILLELVILA